MPRKKKVELLVPAGSPEKMEYAFAYGADAIYIGIPDFSLRVRINRFKLGDVERAIKKAHELKKKIYVTVNIYAHNRHLKVLPGYLKKLNQWKPDGLIVSDPGVMELVKKYAPNCDIHLSTQANAVNWQAVKFWHAQGVKRVILGREVSLEEIKEIHKRVPKVELEYFVHGAMCMSYSGRCILSSWLVGRSANLGDCAQPCRWKYKMGNTNTVCADMEELEHSGIKIPIEEDKNGTYILNSKDLCLIEHLPELVKAGVGSFKIEGRAKSVAYLSAVVKAYREALDLIGGDAGMIKRRLRYLKKNVLEKLMHRGYTTGFLFGRDKVEQDTEQSHVSSDQQFVGEVVDCVKGDKSFNVFVRPHNALRVGDRVRIMRPGEKDLRISIKKMYNEQDEEIKSAHGGAGYLVKVVTRSTVPEYSILQKII